ncbi:LLM class flavin-dependent oxidoreductase [Sporichthya polymorpha]|uniref:LLM class flavin-dependent oxidoreductase n=1 Tax=Sporichthya polymorpha TaxID=35751 RepID=UPI00036FCC00|nr:LLM class flavin-dependent oxidoreductase [Sporichthya polymorpha]
MSESTTSRIGVLLGSTTPPEDIARLSREVEQGGFGQLWIPEDYFFLGGIAAAGIALGATERIPVGLSVVSSMVRHPALLAMEIATLSRAFPGRFLPGIGHGVPAWTAQMGLTVKSPMTALRENLVHVRSLLAGEKVNHTGGIHDFNEVVLTHPATETVPIYTGVLGDKGVALTGELAEGLVVSALAPVEYVAATRAKLDTAAAGRDVRPELVTLVAVNLTSDDSKADLVRQQLRPVLAFYIAATGPGPLFGAIEGANEKVADMIARGGFETVMAEMPDEWIDLFAIAGGPAHAKARIQSYLDAGSDKVVIATVVPEGTESSLAAARELLADFPQ